MSKSTTIWVIALTGFAACSGGADGGADEPVDASRLDDSAVDAALVDAALVDAAVDALSIDAPASNDGFVTPTAITKANLQIGGVWTEVGDPDWTCLDTASPDLPSTGTVALGGRISDFQTGNGVGNGTIAAWSTAPAMTVGTTISANAAATRGDFSMTLGMLPAGTRRYGFTITAQSYVSTVVLGRYYPSGSATVDDIDVISEATASALPALVGVSRDPTAAFYVGSMRDCQGRTVSNAVAAVSTVPSTFTNAGGETFYFSAGSTSLPVRHNVASVMNRDGLFTVLNVPSGPALHVQVWGFRTTAELNAGTMTLLGEIFAPSETGQGVLMRLQPRRT